MEVRVPLYYSVKRGLEPEDIKRVQSALALTPCHAAFIGSPLDHDYALNFTEQVICAENPENVDTLAKEWAERIGRPMLILGCAEILGAVYQNGNFEICLKAD